MKLQFVFPQHPSPRETHRGAGAVRRTNGDLQIFRPVLPPRLSPQELRRYGVRGTTLQPLVLGNTACSAPRRLPSSPLFRPRSTRDPSRCHRKRYAPNRGKWLPKTAKTRNCDALTAQSNPTNSTPLAQDYAHTEQESLHAIGRWLTRAYRLALWPMRSLLPWSLDKSRSLRNAIRSEPRNICRRRRARWVLRPEIVVRVPSARSEHPALHIGARPRNGPDSGA